MKEYKIEGHISSRVPEGKNWRLAWSDEFDGNDVDDSKWSKRLHMMGQRHETWVEDAVSLDGKGNAVFRVTKDEVGYHTTQLQSGENYMDRPAVKRFTGRFTWPIAAISAPKFMHKYGYYECRCRTQQKNGWWTAFWMQSPCNGSTLDPSVSGVEIDIMESFEPNVVMHNVHWNGCGADLKSKGKTGIRLEETPDGFHTFGMEWSKNGYRFFVDGVMTWETDGPVSDREEFILVSAECKGYRADPASPDPSLEDALDDVFVVDYVRVFDEID